jgi:beta-galactosidase
VELIHNGQSLGTKDVKKDAHVAWVVKYAPGSIEARGFKDGKQVMTTARETTTAPAKLVLRADREFISADGEDVAMFAVEVQDAKGHTAPITDNLVTFHVKGPARLIGVGNGDPTDQAPDKGDSRKAFSGYCMALVQSTKKAGTITVEVTSPGLTSATATISCKQVELRPQISVWERSVPKGSGITGLWRPIPEPGSELSGFLGTLSAFTFTQDGSRLSGSVEGTGGFFGGDDLPVAISDASIQGDRITFKSGINSFEGKVSGDQIELKRTLQFPWHRPEPKEQSNPPAIGPAPDESDPSIGSFGELGSGIRLVLKRAER